MVTMPLAGVNSDHISPLVSARYLVVPDALYANERQRLVSKIRNKQEGLKSTGSPVVVSGGH